MITRTITARCDHRYAPSNVYCPATQDILETTTQPFLRLIIDHGWATDTTDEGVLTFCPNHTEDAAPR